MIKKVLFYILAFLATLFVFGVAIAYVSTEIVLSGLF
jgi:hypothetical protein